MAVLEVEDNGPGMEPEFVREKLMKPFKTTKGEGYGIGVYETRTSLRAPRAAAWMCSASRAAAR